VSLQRTLILNLKNYPEILGKRATEIAQVAEGVADEQEVEVIVAPPTPMIGLVASRVKIGVFSQKAESEEVGQSTGALVPESIKAAGASGSILNHSEAPLALTDMEALIPRMKSIGLRICLCAGMSVQVRRLSRFQTEYLAIEPPELIGTGIAVSSARPALIETSIRAARSSGFRGRILCGAGIVGGEDVSKAVKLGVDGVLVSSSVVKARNWSTKLTELANPLH